MLDLLERVACLQSFRQDMEDLCVAYRKVTREWLDIIWFNYGNYSGMLDAGAGLRMVCLESIWN